MHEICTDRFGDAKKTLRPFRIVTNLSPFVVTQNQSLIRVNRDHGVWRDFISPARAPFVLRVKRREV